MLVIKWNRTLAWPTTSIDIVKMFRKFIYMYTHAHTYIFMYKRERKLSSSYSHLMIHDKQKKLYNIPLIWNSWVFFLVLSINAFSLLFRFRLKATWKANVKKLQWMVERWLISQIDSISQQNAKRNVKENKYIIKI